MSDLRVTNLKGRNPGEAPTLPDGVVIAGITTVSSVIVGTGITLSSSGINVSGVITATSFSGNGSGLTGVSAGIGTTGSVNTSGIITATSFFGSGANLTGVAGTSVFAAGSAAAPSISPTGDSNTGIFFPAADTIAFAEGGAEAMRVDSSGRLLVGTSTARANFVNAGETTKLQIEGEVNISAVRTDNTAFPSWLILGKTRSTGNTIVQSGDIIGRVAFEGNDGSEFVDAAFISAEVDGTPGANDMPGRIVLATTADGASNPTERMRITSTGDVLIGTTSVDVHNSSTLNGIVLRPSLSGGFLGISRADGGLVAVNRTGSDGDLVYFNQAGTNEGTISVSGTTVSYNGAHLSRWSQLASGATRIEILRGTVLSNLDEMCEWIDAPKEAVLWQEEEELPEGIDVGDIKESAVESGLQENEQLNRMKVSTVEGDKNVSGVFQCWDDDDDTYTNDFYCAMTGDFIIRVAEGVTVERGDLLTSAGNGTAKPQDDDIIRSKTIAKVTSTNVSCTYDDGSYCVPCVLMAC
jgi:hypothetical protein